MGHGGKRTGSGRPKNAANKFSEAAREKAASEGITPLEYFLDVLRDTDNPREIRMDAGKAAAPYMHARLESIKHSGDDKEPIVHKHKIAPADAFGEILRALDGSGRADEGGDECEAGLAEAIAPSAKDAKG